MRLSLVSLLLLLLAVPSFAAEDEPAVFAAIIDIWPLDGDVDGDYCRPEVLEEGLICLGAPILIQKGALVQEVSSDLSRNNPLLRAAIFRDVDGQYIRFRMIGRHAARRIVPGRYIAIIELTDLDYVYVQWREPLAGGDACFPAWLVEYFGDRLAWPELTPNDQEEMCAQAL